MEKELIKIKARWKTNNKRISKEECSICKSKEKLQYHHLVYDETGGIVVIVCRKCHSHIHLKYPEITEKKCPFCKKLFFRGNNTMKDWRKQKYCSIECRDNSRKRQITLICPICNKTFNLVFAWYKKGTRTCSRECGMKWRMKNR